MFWPYTLVMRTYRRLELRLSKTDERDVRKLLRSGVQQVRVVLRALVRVELCGGHAAPAVARNLELPPKAVRDIGWRYREGGLERALYERQRPGAAPLLSTAERQRIIAMVCSDPPEGRARWTVRLIAEGEGE